MSCIDAAIIKALVEHIGGNPDDVPVGEGGKTYTAGDGISIVNDKIGVNIDTSTMELKDGKLAVKSGVIDNTTRYESITPSSIMSATDDNGVFCPMLAFSEAITLKPGSKLCLTYNNTHYEFILAEKIQSTTNDHLGLYNYPAFDVSKKKHVLVYVEDSSDTITTITLTGIDNKVTDATVYILIKPLDEVEAYLIKSICLMCDTTPVVGA